MSKVADIAERKRSAYRNSIGCRGAAVDYLGRSEHVKVCEAYQGVGLAWGHSQQMTKTFSRESDPLIKCLEPPLAPYYFVLCTLDVFAAPTTFF